MFISSNFSFLLLHLAQYYPVEGLFLSMVVPPSMEAELAGFFVYCTQILGWLPPLVFSLLVEAAVNKGVGVVCISGFFIIAITILCIAAPWNEVIEEVTENMSPNRRDDGEKETSVHSSTGMDCTDDKPKKDTAVDCDI